jgi:hypothetical protein
VPAVAPAFLLAFIVITFIVITFIRQGFDGAPDFTERAPRV